MNNAHQVALKELWPIMKEQIEDGKKVRFGPKGTSMMPLIRQGVDTVVLEKAPPKLKKYDLPLYLRENGQFVLHRIVGENKDGYICCGDNQCEREYGIKDSQILALATGIYKGEEFMPFTDKNYLSYCKKHVFKRRCYYFYLTVYNFLKKRIVKK